jgi:DNA-binding MarR family transcriptional regulator
MHQDRCIVVDMNGSELFRLGRRLMKLGVGAIPPSDFRELPSSVRMVLVDVFENPGSTIGQIVGRTGFPQSHVSSAVARLRDSGVLITDTDPLDRRRTIVAPSPEHLAKVARAQPDLPTVDDALAAALVDRFGPAGREHLTDVTVALEMLARLFTPATPHAPDMRARGDITC